MGLIKELPQLHPDVAYQEVRGLHGRPLPEEIDATIMRRRPRAGKPLARVAEAIWVRPAAAVIRGYQRFPDGARAKWDGTSQRKEGISTSHVVLDVTNREGGLRGGWTTLVKTAIPQVGLGNLLRQRGSIEFIPLWKPPKLAPDTQVEITPLWKLPKLAPDTRFTGRRFF